MGALLIKNSPTGLFSQFIVGTLIIAQHTKSMLQYTYHKKLNIFLVLSLLAAHHRAASVCTTICAINKTNALWRLFVYQKSPTWGRYKKIVTANFVQQVPTHSISTYRVIFNTKQAVHIMPILCGICRLFRAVSDFIAKVDYYTVCINKTPYRAF